MSTAQIIAAAHAMPRRDALLEEAPCAGKWDWTDLPDGSNRMRRDELARFMAPALALCLDCPFTRECLARVQPRESYYDGVAGGHLWRNGACVTAPGIGRPRHNVAGAA